MTNSLSAGRQRIRSLITRGIMVPLKFTLGTSAAIIKAVPLLLVDLLNEDGVTGRAYAFCYRPSGAVAMSSHLLEAVDLLKGRASTPFDVTQTLSRQFSLLGVTGARADGTFVVRYGHVGCVGADATCSAVCAARVQPETTFCL